METLHHLGIDVSKDSLECLLSEASGKNTRIACRNNGEGDAMILGTLGNKVKETHVVLEATSRYHCRIARTLVNAGAQVYIINPLQARSLAKGLGVIDKDDKVDAAVLAQASRILFDKQTKLKSPRHEELRDLSRVINELTQINAGSKKRLKSLPDNSPARRTIAAAIKAIFAEIKKAKKEWMELLKDDEELLHRYKIAISVKDVGPESARVSVCELPAEVRSTSNKKNCAYAGVVPRREQSGKKKGKDKIRAGGNAHLRTGLFMAASRSVFISKTNEDFYKRLRAKGRTHLQAMIAVVHKLLRQIVAVIKRGTPWTETAPSGAKKATISIVACT